MLDIVENGKIINGVAPTTAAAASKYADWVNMEGLNCIWAIINQTAQATPIFFAGVVSTDYVGGSPTTASCQYWRSTGILIDKMSASTATTGLALEAVGGIGICKYTPSGNSTQHFFSLNYTSGTNPGRQSVTYIGSPRFGGLNQILATSSST